MGYLTTFTVLNDHLDLIKKNEKKFAETIYYACLKDKSDTYPLGNHCNFITAQKPRHADDHTFYVHAGNCVFEMSQYSDDTKKLMSTNPKFFENVLKQMEDNIKELKKQFKKHKEENK